MSQPIQNRPLPPIPPQPEAGAQTRKVSSRNPFRRLIAWIKASRLGRAWSNAFMRSRTTTPQQTLPARNPSITNRPLPPVPAPIALPPRKGRLEPIPEEGPSKPPRHIMRQNRRDAVPEGWEIYASINRDTKLARPSIQDTLANTLQQLSGYYETGSHTAERRDFLNAAYTQVEDCLLGAGISYKEAKGVLEGIANHPQAPDTLSRSVRASAKRMTSASQTNMEARQEFETRLERNVLRQLIKTPPKRALEAAQLRGKIFHRALQNRFGFLPVSGAAPLDPDNIESFSNYMKRTAFDMQNNAGWLLDISPNARAFVAEPSHSNLEKLLLRTRTGGDMLVQTWLHTQFELSPFRRTQQYDNKALFASEHSKPYSFLQQSEFCERHFGVGYHQRADDMRDKPQAEMASGIFLAQRLGQKYPKIGADMFALGHIMTMAMTGKVSLRDSAHLNRAITADPRPLVSFVRQNPKSYSMRLSQMPQQKEIFAGQKKQLARPAPSYQELTECFSAKELQAALQSALPTAALIVANE